MNSNFDMVKAAAYLVEDWERAACSGEQSPLADYTSTVVKFHHNKLRGREDKAEKYFQLSIKNRPSPAPRIIDLFDVIANNPPHKCGAAVWELLCMYGADPRKGFQSFWKSMYPAPDYSEDPDKSGW